MRTCTGDPVSSPRWAGSLNFGCDPTIIPLSQCNTNNSSPRRRRPRDEDCDDILKTKDVDSGQSGCGQTVCRTCCFEHPQRSESIEPHGALLAYIGSVQRSCRMFGLLCKATCTANPRVKFLNARSSELRPQFDRIFLILLRVSLPKDDIHHQVQRCNCRNTLPCQHRARIIPHFLPADPAQGRELISRCLHKSIRSHVSA